LKNIYLRGDQFSGKTFPHRGRKLTQKDAIQSAKNGQFVFGVQQKATAGDIPSFAGFPFPFRFDGILEAFKGVTLPVDKPVTVTAF
jgi:hypothetical protein